MICNYHICNDLRFNNIWDLSQSIKLPLGYCSVATTGISKTYAACTWPQKYQKSKNEEAPVMSHACHVYVTCRPEEIMLSCFFKVFPNA